MPHKRNPVGCAVMIAAATRAPGLVATMLSALPQEHERSLGLWHAEWETLPGTLLHGFRRPEPGADRRPGAGGGWRTATRQHGVDPRAGAG